MAVSSLGYQEPLLNHYVAETSHSWPRRKWGWGSSSPFLKWKDKQAGSQGPRSSESPSKVPGATSAAMSAFWGVLGQRG